MPFTNSSKVSLLNALYKALSLYVGSHVTSYSQAECFLSAQHCYSIMTKFACDECDQMAGLFFNIWPSATKICPMASKVCQKSSKFYLKLNGPFKMAKVFNITPKWSKFRQIWSHCQVCAQLQHSNLLVFFCKVNLYYWTYLNFRIVHYRLSSYN